MFPVLIKVNEARLLISTISDAQERGSAAALISATERLFREQPSQLAVSFDLAFLAEIFRFRFREIRAIWRGEYHNVFDELPGERLPVGVPDPGADVFEFGVRNRQAYNYAVAHRCERTRDVLLVLSGAARTRQNPNVRNLSGAPMPPVLRPESPVDYLFLVMAADYALRPGQELPEMLSSAHSGN
jgi:hypothetical protein